MSDKDAGSLSGKIRQASHAACESLHIPQVGLPRLDDALANSIDPQKLIDNFAEAWRTSPEKARAFLESNGLGGVLARLRTPTAGATAGDEATAEPLTKEAVLSLCDGRIRIRAQGPALNAPLAAPRAVLDGIVRSLAAFLQNADEDALGVLYREKPDAYCEKFLATDAPKINHYIREHFGIEGPRYVVNSGIGANEQFNYFVSALANARPDRRTTWLLANSPREAANLPGDATIDNTLFLEFSRSGITEETVKLHEFTPRAARRIVFANAGPLRDLARRDGNLLLELPSEVSGRYGRNKTPILLAPMHVCGLDVRNYWRIIAEACKRMNLGDPTSAPVVLARYIRTQQLRRGVNHIYFGTNDALLRHSADEFCQYWNEGVNRDGNDITVSRYLGLPRDSHMNLEAILGTAEHKMAIFLLRTGEFEAAGLLQNTIDPVDPLHAGLTPARTDLVLALANVQRCSEKMPTIVIAVDRADLPVSAWLGQLWADTTLVYSRLIGCDPGSNPEVKAVRTRAATWLADPLAAMGLLSDDR